MHKINDMEETNKITQAHQDYRHAADAIKEAILNAQYEAARGVNSIQLMLYFAIGRFISQNTRKGKWGTNALGTISKLLKVDMPGLRGYSETNLKRMRTFYEEWSELDSFQPMNVDCNSPIQTDELEIIENQNNVIVWV